jgi:hypothetical protein
MSIETLKGSCHCGAVSFSARIDLSAQTFRCNCSICTKSRAWIAPIPAEDFELLSGGDTIAEYRFGAHAVTHCFCSRCGIKTHGRRSGEAGNAALVAVCVSTLDLSPEQFATIPISYADGRNDAPQRPPKVTAYL